MRVWNKYVAICSSVNVYIRDSNSRNCSFISRKMKYDEDEGEELEEE
jgi:hypothetical protein